ncbi:MAG: Ig-like domain-containing protein [Clostridiales bacterium]|nr:Ig-like domain-containing protein [Clostridiales bacterium]
MPNTKIEILDNRVVDDQKPQFAAITEMKKQIETVEAAHQSMLSKLAELRTEQFLKKFKIGDMKIVGAGTEKIKDDVILAALSDSYKNFERYESVRSFWQLDREGSADQTIDGVGLKPGIGHGSLRPQTVFLSLGAQIILDVGQKKQIVATSVPATDNQEVTWTSSNPAVATVGDDDSITYYDGHLQRPITIIKPAGSYAGEGLITAVACGKTVITATNKTSGDKAQIEVEVQIMPKSVIVTPKGDCITSDGLRNGVQFNAEVLPHNATDKSVTWYNFDPQYINLSNTGFATFVLPLLSPYHMIYVLATTNIGNHNDIGSILLFIIN